MGPINQPGTNLASKDSEAIMSVVLLPARPDRLTRSVAQGLMNSHRLRSDLPLYKSALRC